MHLGSRDLESFYVGTKETSKLIIPNISSRLGLPTTYNLPRNTTIARRQEPLKNNELPTTIDNELPTTKN